jgi:hypothetical protein
LPYTKIGMMYGSTQSGLSLVLSRAAFSSSFA